MAVPQNDTRDALLGEWDRDERSASFDAVWRHTGFEGHTYPSVDIHSDLECVSEPAVIAGPFRASGVWRMKKCAEAKACVPVTAQEADAHVAVRLTTEFGNTERWGPGKLS